MTAKPATVPRKRSVRRLDAATAKDAAVAYAVSGGLDALRDAVSKGLLPGGVRALLIPTDATAEGALRMSPGFRRTTLPAGAFEAGMRAADAIIQTVRSAQAPGVETDAYEPDARARAILRGRAYAGEDLRAAGGAYSVDEVRTLLGVSRQALDKRVKEGSLLAVPGPSGGRRFPTLQFDQHGGLLRGLKQVQGVLGFSSPWAVLNFLVTANDRLSGQKPIDALRRGELDGVIAAAAALGVQGA